MAPVNGEKVEIARRLRTARRASDFTQDALDLAVGVPVGRTSSYETGRAKATDEFLRAVSTLLDVSFVWLKTGKGSMQPGLETVTSLSPGATPPNPLGQRAGIPGGGRRLFPLVGRVGAALVPVQNEGDFGEDYVEFSDDLFEEGRYSIMVRGDSQSPLIRGGDYVLINPTTDIPVGVFGVFGDEEKKHVIKLMKYGDDGRPELHSVNPEYKPIKVPEGWSKVGYVIAVRRERGKGKHFELANDDGMSPKDWEA